MAQRTSGELRAQAAELEGRAAKLEEVELQAKRQAEEARSKAEYDLLHKTPAQREHERMLAENRRRAEAERKAREAAPWPKGYAI